MLWGSSKLLLLLLLLIIIILLLLLLLLYSPLFYLGHFFSLLILFTVGRTPWEIDQSVAGPLPICRTAKTQNKCTETSMPRVELEPTIPALEWAKRVHAFDRATTVIGSKFEYTVQIRICVGFPVLRAFHVLHQTNTATSCYRARESMFYNQEFLSYSRRRLKIRTFHN
jgi:hypothetical protein